jgi:prephenate dehydrogenase
VQWNKIALVGVGLLGGSLGLALKQRRLAGSVVGYVRRPASVAECQGSGAVDAATLNLAEAVAGAELIVLCTPIAQMPALTKAMLPALKAGAIVTDVGSVKASVVRALEGPVAGSAGYFVGSHPMAGSEKTGVLAARADLFEDAVCVVTPGPQCAEAALGRVEELWRGVGGRLLRLSPEVHDDLVSRSSHLPHIMAATLANLVLGPGRPPHQELLCANGFRDTTRVASGSPEMWRDIALANSEPLLRAIEELVSDLEQFKAMLQRRDSAALARFLEQAKECRDAWRQHHGSPSPE